MVNWKRVVFLAVLFGLIYAWPTEGQTLAVVPTHCMTPCEVRLELRIERAAINRWWSISHTNTDGRDGGASGGSLEGENSEGVFPVCTAGSYRGCYRTLRESGTWIFVGCVHKLVDGKLKPVCVQKEVIVGETWMPTTSVTSAKRPSAPTSTTAPGSALWKAIRFGTATSARSADRY